MPLTPEDKAREIIDSLLEKSGWHVCNLNDANIHAHRGVVIRNFPLKSGHGFADYIFYVDGKAAGVIEAKKAGETLTGVEIQSDKYKHGLPDALRAWYRPLPFCYQSTGIETRFTNGLDPDPRSRNVFSFHKPETLLELLTEDVPAEALQAAERFPDYNKPFTFYQRLQEMPPLIEEGLWSAQIKAIKNLEKSLSENRPRALIQMATGSGKTFTAVTFIYRLLKFAKAKRVLFLVDRKTLGNQTLKEFQQYDSPYSPFKFTEEFIVQHLQSGNIDKTARVCISTIQRLYSILKGEEIDPALEEESLFDHANLFMEYPHEQGVSDGVNVNYDVYRIRTKITQAGSKVDAGYFVDKRDRETRAVRWERLDEELEYNANQLDTDVVAIDQIRTVIKSFRDNLFTEIFPGRKDVPKTLVFAKDDSHAEDIVKIIREEFAKGNEFCQKITYKTTGASPEQLIRDFRTNYFPRIAVTVDMISTGTDIKPLEIVFFMRNIKSRSFFEQLKGRGVRVINPNELQSVTPDAKAKTHFIIVDAVGVCEQDKTDSRPMEKTPSISL